MTPEQTNAAEKMTSVKAACEKAPSGPRKDRALKHYQAAEKAHETNNYDETNRELDAAAEAIS
ncbi:hypothetical protein [Phaeobacter inhibens]|uniref:hypothetical protein n=1 Tax=Phaeobacter inhibens TaxID=221822 RepID=UPI000C9B7DA7|nr:hypothetical protein [Phaeobacter inhibens]AUQ57605.1 hypothetical protein PhaeoP30_00663 [Phaeobacter inhibens]AUQ61640.1 hypothetical protein PhaeoP51_00623 [Phaeobacter inhibens]AUQ69098.1 hypothetical protein PhaeoP54_00173 [Phaeobacter inhibens]AUQ81614.1 hypothetical protein PhaeoP57_00655 [Phaeobacter inhibens]AUQ89270.1 hypothetical protein PhaeoP24_00623 [Phaeobacter inhibens]